MIQSEIKKGVVEAMKAKDETRIMVLRGVLSAFTNENVAKKRKPDEAISDDEALVVVARLAKQRKDSIEQFKSGGRADLAENEANELVILEEYLPAQMGKDEVEKIVRAKMEALDITDKSGMGKLMGAVMAELKGKADGSMVKNVIESIF